MSFAARHPCPCCGLPTLEDQPSGTYAICPDCGWEDDPVQAADPAFSGGANKVSLRERRRDILDSLHVAEPGPRAADLTLGPFKLWVLGYQFPEAQDFWDGNWLVASACCRVNHSEVWTDGAILRVDELQQWMDQCRELDSTLKGSAVLSTMEELVKVRLEASHLGQLELTVDITPDHLTESHQFSTQLDQSYLKPLVHGLLRLLSRFPLKSPAV